MRRLLSPIAACLCLCLIAACDSKDPGGGTSTAPSPSASKGRLVGKASLTIGVKVDQPGLGEIVGGDPRKREGFEIDVANYVARGLGVGHIEWYDVFSRDRISVLETGKVDLVISAFAISANRLDKVVFAGPYIMSGQDIIVRTQDAATTKGLSDLKDKRVCSIVNSVSVDRLIQEFGKSWDVPAHLIRLESTRECINELLAGKVDAVSTGNIILAGYAAEQPTLLHLVNRPFTVDNVGVGMARTDEADVAMINKILQRMIDDGTWAASVKRNFGGVADLFLANPPVPGQLKPSWSIPNN